MFCSFSQGQFMQIDRKKELLWQKKWFDYSKSSKSVSKRPEPQTSEGLRRFGFAGGLGPSTVQGQLEAMSRACEA